MSTGPQAQGAGAAQQADTQHEVNLLDDIIKQARLAPADDRDRKTHATNLLKTFADLIVDETMKVSDDTQSMIQAQIAAIDDMLTKQLNLVMHAEDFKKLEASWRGLHYLVGQTETSERLKIRVLNVGKKDLWKDLEKATPSTFDQTGLFKKVYEEGFGQYGGEPFGVLVGDYEFGRHPQDVELLTRLSNVAASAHAPFISGASSELFGWDEYQQMSGHASLEKIFRTDDYIKWRTFRETEDSRYVGLCLPHILMRLPYGPDTNPVDDFNFAEDVDGRNNKKYLWGNAAYAFAARITDSFARYNWCATIRGVQSGGLVPGLPVHVFPSEEGDIASKCPTELAISDRREKELSDLGFIPLLHCKGTDYAAFFGAQSSQKPAKYDKDEANANARLSAQLPYIFSTCRFAHYLKAMMRDYVGSFMSRDQCEKTLTNWIRNYVTEDKEASASVKAEKPLQEARIEVAEIPGKPGCYRAVAFLKPHFQLEELTVSLRLVAELPSPTGGR